MSTVSAYTSRVFSVVSQMYRANQNEVSLKSPDGVRHLSRLIAEQLAHESHDANWGYNDQGYLVYKNGVESFYVDWVRNGAIRFPLQKGPFEGSDWVPAAPVDHFATPTLDKIEAEVVEQSQTSGVDTLAELTTLKLRADRQASTLEIMTEIMGEMQKQLDEIRAKQDRSYTARLNFKTVTFHPVDKDVKK